MLHSLLNFPTSEQAAVQDLREHGVSLLSPGSMAMLLHADAAQWQALRPSWDLLPADPHLKDGGHYRKRRHASFVLNTARAQLQQEPHRAHWQPVDYNALHGGFERWFEPVEPHVANSTAWTNLLTQLGLLLNKVLPTPHWYIEAHQFRIDTANGVGRPTPEGAHRDGVDFVAVVLLDRQRIKGGESRVFEANGPQGLRFEMSEPLTALLLDDKRVIHETTPIFPMDAQTTTGFRDTLVLTYRSDSFQDQPK